MQLSPDQIYKLSDQAYETKGSSIGAFKDKVKYALPFVDKESVRIITATSGVLTSTLSGFGFMAQLNGGRSKEIVIATRGTTASCADVATDLNAIPMTGPTGPHDSQGLWHHFQKLYAAAQ
jgi:hypothetical protein